MVRIKTVLNFLAYGIALLGFIPLFPYLESVPRLMFPAALVCGIMADRGKVRIQVWVPTVISLAFFIFYALQFTRENLVGPAVNLLVILLSVRLFSEKTARNYLQVFALSLFAFTSSSLFNLSPVFLVYLFLILILISVSLVILTFYSSAAETLVSSHGLKRILSVALIMPVAALPLMLILFIILPRTQFPLWDFLNIGGAQTTGFSEKVEPGRAASVGKVKNVAFRAGCAKLPKDQLYWRGIVLNSFEGNAWVRREMPAGEEGALVKGTIVSQIIFPEPGRTTYLMALNVPRSVSGVRYTREDDYTFTAKGRGIGRIKYEALSVQSDMIVTRKVVDREFYLRVPEKLSQRVLDLGKRIAGKGKSDEAKVSQLEDIYSERKLTYATTDLPIGDNSFDQFLFEKKRGHCEFFASSFATLLRLSGVPARLVGGYYGGEYNELGGYYVVTEEMAHVWVEAYLSGKGWVMIDPSRWAVNYSEAREAGNRGFTQRLGMTVDAFSYYWNLAVINYDLERQLRMINSTSIGLKGLSLRAGSKMFLYFALFPLAMAITVIAAKRKVKVSREERVLAKFLRKVKKEFRIQIAPETGLHELSATLHNPMVSRFVTLYGSAVYHDRRLEPEEVRELEGLIRNLTGPKSGDLSGSGRSPRKCGLSSEGEHR